jgi:hypothetical protein
VIAPILIILDHFEIYGFGNIKLAHLFKQREELGFL